MSKKSKPVLPTQDPSLSNHQRHVLRAAERAEREVNEANADKRQLPEEIDRPPYKSPQTFDLGIKTYKRTHKGETALIRSYKQNAWQARRDMDAKRAEMLRAAQQKNAKPFIQGLKSKLAK